MRLLIVVVAGLVLAGCSPAEGPTESPSVSVEPSPTVEQTTLAPSSSPSPTVESVSPTPVPTEFQSYPADLPTEDPETAAIIEGWQAYQSVYEKFARSAGSFTDEELVETQTVTWGDELLTIVERLKSLQDQGLELHGDRQFRDIKIGTMAADEDGHKQARLSYCIDVNRVELHSVTGAEAIQRSGTYIENVTMLKADDGVWRVAYLSAEEAEC